ncbi:MAG: calcium/sodium antiporter [Trueperaceae bacterium]|nr:calcium/sodium antiporter [Trueperaceae bacterium]
MLVLPIFLVAIGVAALYFGGDLLVNHASRLARSLGISPMVVGLTVVAFGTSTPELAATLAASLRGAPEIALGNVTGSNIANIGLILGLTAIFYPLATEWSFLRREIPWLLAVTVVVLPLAYDGRLGRLEGLVLVGLLAAFLIASFRSGGAPGAGVGDVDAVPPGSAWRSWAWVAVGVVVLAGGAQALVAGATTLALSWGVPERVIGLTLVAVGTSLPELASSLAAALRRETDIILGNVVGSNLFNLLAVLGTASLVHPVAVPPEGLRIDLWVMLAFTVVVVPLLLWRGPRLGRRRGGFLFAFYVAYIALLFA